MCRYTTSDAAASVSAVIAMPFSMNRSIVLVKMGIVWATLPRMDSARLGSGSRSDWRPNVNRRRGVLYLAIVDALRESIRSGDLRPGDRMPTHRDLARHLGVNISTVTHAYAEASRLHLLSGQVGRGTFVLGESVDAALFAATYTAPLTDDTRTVIRTHIDLSSNIPARKPDDRDLARTFAQIAKDDRCNAGYLSPSDVEKGRVVVSELLLRRGFSARRNDIVLAAGAQQGLLAALIAVAGAGSRVMAEELTFPGMKSVVRHLNLTTFGVAIDHEGLVAEDLARVARRSGATVIVCVPSLQNPTGTTMSEQRRQEIAEVVRRRNLTVIEDDVYGLLQNEMSLTSLIPDLAILVTSLSKSVAPGLRLGALAGRHPALASIARDVSLTSWVLSPMMVEVAGRWLSDGTIDERIAWQRSEIASRCQLVDALLGVVGPRSPHRWLSTQTAPEKAARLASEAGVEVVAGSALALSARVPKGIRLSLTAACSRSELHEAVTRLQSTAIRWAF